MQLIHVLRLFLVIALVLVPATVAQASDTTWRLGLDVGGTNFDNDVDNGGDLRVGVRGSWHPNARFGLELELSRSQAIFSADLDTVMVNGLYHFGSAERSWRPYLKAGLGSVSIEDRPFPGLLDPDPLRSDSGLGAQLGVGVVWLRPGGRWGVRFEGLGLYEEASSDSGNVHRSGLVGVVLRIGG